MSERPAFEVVATERLSIRAHEPLQSWYHLSPYVWKTSDAYELLLRGVPRRDDNPALKIAQTFYGTSHDGITFEMRDTPVIAPGPQPGDLDGCEDPTYVAGENEAYVFYTGWNEQRRAANLLYARGSDVCNLRKYGVAIAWNDVRRNPKEATVVRADDGTWLMFYEFSSDDASCIGIARSASLDGPWTARDAPFRARDGSWDSWHLSTGPVVTYDGLPLMFYNGGTRAAAWRIGWIRFDREYHEVVDRCDEPVVAGAPVDGGTDITFAASAVVERGVVQLYYSVSDQLLLRTTLAPASPRAGSLLR